MDTIYLTTNQIASITRTTKALIDRLIVSERIPFNQYHHRAVIKLSDLVLFLAGKLSEAELKQSKDLIPVERPPLEVRLNQGRSPP